MSINEQHIDFDMFLRFRIHDEVGQTMQILTSAMADEIVGDNHLVAVQTET